MAFDALKVRLASAALGDLSDLIRPARLSYTSLRRARTGGRIGIETRLLTDAHQTSRTSGWAIRVGIAGQRPTFFSDSRQSFQGETDPIAGALVAIAAGRSGRLRTETYK